MDPNIDVPIILLTVCSFILGVFALETLAIKVSSHITDRKKAKTKEIQKFPRRSERLAIKKKEV